MTSWTCIDNPDHGIWTSAELTKLAMVTEGPLKRFTCPMCKVEAVQGKPHGFGYMRLAHADVLASAA